MSSTKDYWVGPVIGQGSFGNVVYAQHKHTGREVAVKVIEKITCQKRAEVLQSILAEKRALETLKSSSSSSSTPSSFVVSLWASFVDSQCVYMVMELAHGGDLQQLISSQFSSIDADGVLSETHGDLHMKKAHKKFSSSTTERNNNVSTNHPNTSRQHWYQRVPLLARQLCCAMEYIHSKNIIHCDLKPANILVKLHSPSISTSTFQSTGDSFVDSNGVQDNNHLSGGQSSTITLQLADFGCSQDLSTYRQQRMTTDVSKMTNTTNTLKPPGQDEHPSDGDNHPSSSSRLATMLNSALHFPRGTAEYACPEIIRGMDDEVLLVDADGNDDDDTMVKFWKSMDIWSLGCIFCCLWTGASPFATPSEALTIQAISDYCTEMKKTMTTRTVSTTARESKVPEENTSTSETSSMTMQNRQDETYNLGYDYILSVAPEVAEIPKAFSTSTVDWVSTIQGMLHIDPLDRFRVWNDSVLPSITNAVSSGARRNSSIDTTTESTFRQDQQPRQHQPSITNREAADSANIDNENNGEESFETERMSWGENFPLPKWHEEIEHIKREGGFRDGAKMGWAAFIL